MEQQPEFADIDGIRYKIADIPQLAIDLFNKVGKAQNQIDSMAASIEAMQVGIKEMRSNAMSLLPPPVGNIEMPQDAAPIEAAPEETPEAH